MVPTWSDNCGGMAQHMRTHLVMMGGELVSHTSQPTSISFFSAASPAFVMTLWMATISVFT